MPKTLKLPIPRTISAVDISPSVIVVIAKTLKLPIALTSMANVINQSMPTRLA